MRRLTGVSTALAATGPCMQAKRACGRGGSASPFPEFKRLDLGMMIPAHMAADISEVQGSSDKQA
jgi:hypothetical protein